MSKSKPRYRLHVSEGAPGTCPDCGDLTPFHRASLVGELTQQAWTIDQDVLRALADSLKQGLRCATCHKKPARRLIWANLGQAAIVGPFCTTCVRSEPSHLEIYSARASKDTLREAALIREFAPTLSTEIPDTDTDVLLF